MEDRYSVKVLQEAIEIQRKKGADYQNKVSSVRQADYYPRGIDTIYDIMWGKMLRIKSVMDAMRSGQEPNFESLKDSAIDLINYGSFMAAYLEGKIDGQNPNNDMFNQQKVV